MTLKQIIEDTDTRPGRLFDLMVQALVVVSLIGYAFETVPGLDPVVVDLLYRIEVGCVAAFTVEYFLRIAVARPRTGYIFSFYGLVDLGAILPFYLAGLDARSLRALRLLRLFRAFKLFRYNRALDRFGQAIRLVREELILFVSAMLIVLYLAAAGIHYFESEAQPEVFSSLFDGLWWAVVTLTTVGYGDAFPITSGGRFFTFIVLLVGLGVVAIPTALIASALTTARAREREEAREDID